MRAPSSPGLTRAGVTRLLKAARDAGYRRAKVTAHPDGRVELEADDPPPTGPEPNEWDEVLH